MIKSEFKFACYLLFFLLCLFGHVFADGKSDVTDENFLAERFAEEPDGYRLNDYRGHVPNSLKDGKVIDVYTAKKLFDAGETLFIDVLYYNFKPANFPKNSIWIKKTRKNIKNSIWLANVGMGVINEVLETYFKKYLSKFTQGDLDKKIVFYCLPKCWLSWNAAKRAISYGYRKVYWFPGGTVVWKEKKYPTHKSTPIPIDTR